MVEDNILEIDKKIIEVKRNVFQTIVYEINTQFNNQSTLNFLNKKTFEENSMLTTFYEDKNILDNEDLIELNNHILKTLDIFIKRILKKTSFYLEASWFQAYRVNDYHNLHIHGLEEDCYSFIFYIQCGENSAQTEFYIPGHPYIISPSFSIEAENSKIVIFPGNVPHEVHLNKDEKRIILSGNFKVK